MNPPFITVSYNGGEKKVPLAVRPSLELSDSQVSSAQGELHKVLRKIFNVEQGVQFYLHEVETKRVMSKESFREPTYCQTFPTHWYMVMDKFTNGTGSLGLTAERYQYSNGPIDNLSDDLLSRLGVDTPPYTESDHEDSPFLPLADLSSVNTKYQNFTLKGARDSGCSLRYFSIQPLTSPVNSPTHSRSDSFVSNISADSMDTLKLSTIFICHVRPGSLADKVGLEEGFVVHMINKDSILRSSLDEMRQLVGRCGDRVTLLGLPQESDDLQFLYPSYTKGPEGKFTTEDGLITVVDIPIILGSLDSGPNLSPNGHSPPVGMVPFDDEAESQENSLSCEPYSLSCDPTLGNDDILIMGSLSEIGTREMAKWRVGVPPPIADGSPNHTHQNGNGLEFPSAALNLGTENVDKEWYCHDDDDDGNGNLPLASFKSQEKNVRAPSTDSHSQGDRSLPSPLVGLDDLSQGSEGWSHSTALGPVKLKKKGRKSLEALTRIGSDVDPVKSLEALTRIGANVDPVKDGDSGTSPFKRHNSAEAAAQFNTEAEDWKHGWTSSDTSQPYASGSQLTKPSLGQLSGQSSEDQHVSDESGVASVSPSFNTHSSSSVIKSSNSAGGRRPLHGYQSKRALLHKSRSKTTVSELENSTSEKQLLGGTESKISKLSNAASTPPGYISSLVTPATSGAGGNSSLAIVRHRSVKERTQTDLSLPEREKLRPLSAIEPSLDSRPTHVPNSENFSSFHGGSSLYTTRTTLTPSGEEEIIREVNIEEAIARSQGGGLSYNHANSLEDTLESHSRKRGPYTRNPSLTVSSGLSDQFSSCISPFPPPQSETILRGLLSIKRAQDRSWKSYYAVLSGGRIHFYKDRRDAILDKPADEPPLNVIPATVEMENKGTKQKFVFRLVTGAGQSYLLQADDAPNRQNWIELIQQLNNAHKPKQLLSSSPVMPRRLSSPQPSTVKPKFLDRIKKSLSRQRGSDEPDFSSFTTFGQPLQNCPVSPDNKRVPLVVECCVREVEMHGMEVEGIYRKTGLVAMINTMSTRMDKGNYTLDSSEYGHDIHTVGSLLKKFFMELPDPLIPSSMHREFFTCARLTNEEARLSTLKDLVYHLPTAHYHTLRYLMRHLAEIATHSDKNKMTLNNVSTVFGPTLMRSPSDIDDKDLIVNMQAGNDIVMLLCKHVEYLCKEELCFEEIEAQEKATESIPEQEERASKVSPTRNSQPQEMETKLQKDQALATASPQSVRRIKNKIADKAKSSLKRHSATNVELFGTIPKQMNWSGSGTISHSSSSYMHASNSSLGKVGVSPGPGDGEVLPRKRVVRHMYEDVEVLGRDEERRNLDSRTVNWVNHHTEMNWGRDQEAMEVTGSMWSSRNRDQRHQTSRGKARSVSKRVPKPRIDQGKDFHHSSSYRGLSSRHSFILQSTGPVPQHNPQHPAPPTVPASMDHSKPRPRRISYQCAIGDVPVKETSSHRTREEKYKPSDYLPSYSTPHLATSGGGNSSSSHRRDDTVAVGRYSQRASYPHPSHQHPTHNKYGNMQREMTTTRPPFTRRSSDSSEHTLEGGSMYFHVRGHTHGIRPHRTFSNGSRTFTPPSPPQRGDSMTAISHQQRTTQVESYL